MRTRLRLGALLPLALLAGCFVGPHQLRRSVDDWDHDLYVNSPWWNATLWLVPVIPVSSLGATVLDFLITDPWHFWFDDAWDGSGTGFRHLPVEWPDGKVDSLFLDRSLWTRVDK